MLDYSNEDVGNIVHLEHINLQVPDQALATLFYIVGLGLTRDPYFNIGVRNMWANAGEQQFSPAGSTRASDPRPHRRRRARSRFS